MLELLLASGNAHKAEELGELFDSTLAVVQSAPEKIEVVEDGATFEANALKKAEGYYQKYQRPILSDDSGIVVDALPDQLGIQSARFGGEGLTDRDRVNLLLEKMEGVEESRRGAYFTCTLCLYLNPEEIFFFEGRVEGYIGHEVRGSDGFGYDPVFMPTELKGENSFAEVIEWKMENSHRARAAQKACNFLKNSNF